MTMAQLDARLVKGLGLAPAATAFADGARAAGLTPPSRFGTEVVARLIGLRVNHPAAQDDLELGPNDPATRAEAAYSAAQALQPRDWRHRRARRGSVDLRASHAHALADAGARTRRSS